MGGFNKLLLVPLVALAIGGGVGIAAATNGGSDPAKAPGTAQPKHERASDSLRATVHRAHKAMRTQVQSQSQSSDSQSESQGSDPAYSGQDASHDQYDESSDESYDDESSDDEYDDDSGQSAHDGSTHSGGYESDSDQGGHSGHDGGDD
jgi:hypothetical protein